MMTMITMMTMMLMARVCEGNGDGDVYDDSGGYGDDYYSGELKEACLNCVVGAIVVKDADDILNNSFIIHPQLPFGIFQTSENKRCAANILYQLC